MSNTATEAATTVKPDMPTRDYISENTQLQQFLFLIILLMLLAGGVQSLSLIGNADDAVTLQTIAFIGMSIAGCLLAYILSIQQRTEMAAIIAIASLMAPIMLRAVVSGLGIRSPVIYLMAPPILMAYYVLGIRASQIVASLACLCVFILYGIEISGVIPGLTQDNLPASAVNLITTWILIICGLSGANAIRERKDQAIAIARKQQSMLEKTLDDIAMAEASQRQFMQVITGTVSQQADALYQLSHSGESTSGSTRGTAAGPTSLPAMQTDQILELSMQLTQSLDRAVEQTERETQLFLSESDPPAPLRIDQRTS